MGKKKINNREWNYSNEIILKEGYKEGAYLVAENTYYQKHKSEHGRSTDLTECGFCNTEHEVFTWSYRGCGKRCTNCNAHLLGGKTWALVSLLKFPNDEEIKSITNAKSSKNE